MTADAQFNRWMKIAALLFILVCGYIFITDLTIPMTPHSMVQRPVVTIAPRVSGEVVEVAVKNNQYVEKGEVLFRIDDSDYKIAVEKAKLALFEAQQTNDNLNAQLAEADANIIELQVTLEEAQRELKRLSRLAESSSVSVQLVDQKKAEVASSRARLNAMQQQKQALKIQLGETGEGNLRWRIAKNTLKQAELDLARTVVRAPKSGVISNLQLFPGIQANANQSLLSLVASGEERIVADFREKSLSKISENSHAMVVFDALPGMVFDGEIISRDMGVSTGQLMANGLLVEPDDSDRWVRDAQRVRVYVALRDHNVPDSLVSGARATVMLEYKNSGLLHLLGKLQMKLVSLLHYVY
ncbi:HlyD family secretion protein [Alteromonas sp. 14N.309.X.WAT.G.H12]|uniref:HlyD family secretion protein n=1 Tax=Alteromonas sp. 14N.309.X.WAT.G.H12 TaxID=3120824 RepID=UPI002FD0CC51